MLLFASCRPAEAPVVPAEPTVSSPLPAPSQGDVVQPPTVGSAEGSTSAPLSSLPTPTPGEPRVPPVEAGTTPEFVPAPDGTSGAIITAQIGPSCPGPERPGQECTKPYQGDLKVTNASGAEIAQARTADNGQAKLVLPPGEYVVELVLDKSGPYPRGTPVTFTVKEGQYTNVLINLDSGIR